MLLVSAEIYQQKRANKISNQDAESFSFTFANKNPNGHDLPGTGESYCDTGNPSGECGEIKDNISYFFHCFSWKKKSLKEKMLRTIKDYSFIIVSSCLIIFESIYISKGICAGDFWEHSAVINELSKNLFQPKNPIIQGDVPHVFFSPYSIAVAAFSKIFALNSIRALTYFAFFNLLFFLFSFYKFIKTFFKENSDSLRMSIIKKYQPDYILFDFKSINLNPSTLKWLHSIGKNIYKKEEIEVLSVKNI